MKQNYPRALLGQSKKQNYSKKTLQTHKTFSKFFSTFQGLFQETKLLQNLKIS